MVGGDGQGLIFGGHDDGAPGQVIGFSEEPSGALVDGGHRRFIEDVVSRPADVEVMAKVFMHLA
ncbi:MAG: hypothetical protein JRJ54_13410, partial [Deltaproteobacteria bacterium]|nr:hypothetical protein [Deltaproteobacteria bacterium]